MPSGKRRMNIWTRLRQVDSAAEARYVLTDILDLPIAVFPEEEFASTYYIRSVYPKVHRPEYSTFDPTGMTDLRVLYNLEEVQHFDEHFDRNRCVSVVVNYNRSKTILEPIPLPVISLPFKRWRSTGTA